jgi:hypothetical protein
MIQKWNLTTHGLTIANAKSAGNDSDGVPDFSRERSAITSNLLSHESYWCQ